MPIKRAEFIKSSKGLADCPEPTLFEFAFIGRSNVGKSSLINMITNRKNLAKTSGTPGKTQLINHFLIDGEWHLVDLPGYGFAKTSKKIAASFENTIKNFLQKRETLACTFVLIDIRHEPQKLDLDFMEWLGLKEIPFNIIFTKADKLSEKKCGESIALYKRRLLDDWAFLPETFTSSAITAAGREDILEYIVETNSALSRHLKK